MTQQATAQNAEPMVTCGRMMAGMKAGESPMSMCPMAAMLKDSAEKPASGFLLMVPGLLLIAVGVLIVFEPMILVWLVAAASVLFGIMLLIMARFLRRFGARFRAAEGDA